MTVVTQPRLPRRERSAHKGNFGKVHIIAGRVGYTGAPVLAASAAVRGGAGLVSLGVPGDIYPIVAGKLLSPMPSPLPGGAFPGLESCDAALKQCEGKSAVLLGPGLGREEETAALIRRLCRETDCPLVLDADGLNALAGHIDDLDSRQGRITVLTPHEGEFARLLGRPVHDRFTDAADFAQAHGCAVVLKGRRTLVCYPDGAVFENPTGNPGMAVGGSGDVLAGLILAFLGQGLPIQWAVYLHGRAGDLAAAALGEYAMGPGDVLDYLPAAMKEAEGI